MNIAGRIDPAGLPRVCPLVSRRANRQYGGQMVRVVRMRDVQFGAARPVVIAGPCAIESREQMLELAGMAKQAGADMLRGGAYKPRTSPYEFQGMGREGLEALREAGRQTGLPVVTEVMDTRLVEQVAEYADMIHIGSRNMQCYPLLTEVGRAGKPVLLKRGMAASLVEWLGAAEYIAKEGNLDIVLCERGIKCFPSGEYTRFSLDLTVIQALREETFLPVIVDPSHATGVAAMVESASRAALEFGADGVMLDISSGRADAPAPKSDAAQAIGPEQLRRIVDFAHAHARVSEW